MTTEQHGKCVAVLCLVLAAALQVARGMQEHKNVQLTSHVDFAIVLATVDCAGEWSACTDKCEKAADRTWTTTTIPEGNGKACPEPGEGTDCQPGEGSCVKIPKKNPNIPPPCCNKTNATTLGKPNCTEDDFTGFESWYLKPTDKANQCKEWDGAACKFYEVHSTCEQIPFICNCSIFINGAVDDEETRWMCRKEEDWGFSCQNMDDSGECNFGKRNVGWSKCARWSWKEEEVRLNMEDRTAPWEDCKWMKKESPDKALWIDACTALVFDMGTTCIDWAVEWKNYHEDAPEGIRDAEKACMSIRTEFIHRQQSGLTFPASTTQVCMWCLEHMTESMNPY